MFQHPFKHALGLAIVVPVLILLNLLVFMCFFISVEFNLVLEIFMMILLSLYLDSLIFNRL